MAFVMLYRLFFFLLLLKLVAGQDKESIILGSHLLASDEPSSWKSSFGDFAFGFRYLEDQELFLLAIWFNKIPDRTIVWYANGDNPVPKGSKVELTADGQLSLTDPRQQVIWETRPGSTGVAYAAMLDTGNFVLAFNESDYAWESFKNPTDTMLPTQALDIGEKLSSGQMAGNFLKGRFQLRMLPEGNLVLNTMSVPSEYAYEPYYVSNTEDSGNSFNSGFRLIIHCDIKPQNILLDDSLTAKISDFGLAKLLLSDQTRTNTAIRGTRGYIAPEWFKNIPITAKADVYSYGVILLEIICCRKNVEQGMEDEDEFVLTDWAYDCYRHRELHKLLKSDKEARNDRKRVEKLVMVAIWCIQEDPCLRPTMKKVIQMLEGVIDVSVPPCPFPLSSVC
ncbi:G-type lectin S-receptor-like serine/threonine-protein kinase LECRK3 [Carica papaya]|uniref:G-type lectin S-receptor-like serine/threonine-protein kinase LECRK3 n=1 Tax=Carica papaya TaxID=3649 RepID=UPI000B8C93AD|nr:G-type lectin S-receptor-like serine/threonine-protein kinase LECRK3 [Carica papaya]